MKLIIAIIPDNTSDAVSRALTSADYRVTYIASTGGFLRRGHSTLLIGLEDEQVEPALKIIRQNSNPTQEVTGKHGVVFVLKVDQYIHF
jgi:uncharacterized protein YaaQ